MDTLKRILNILSFRNNFVRRRMVGNPFRETGPMQGLFLLMAIFYTLSFSIVIALVLNYVLSSIMS